MLVTYCALVLMAVVPIWLGSHRSLTKSYEVDELTSKDVYMFPVMGSAVLFSLYLLFKFLSPKYINLLLSFYFTTLGVSALTSVLLSVTRRIVPKSVLDHPGFEFHIPTIPFICKSTPVKISLITLLTGSIATLLGIWYIFTRNWIATNLFGESFSIMGVELISLGSFKMGCILLGGLFFYDIFWVFGTDVMVTVAKSIDGPIKVMFPKNLFPASHEAMQFSMLGLGDIVIPGIFIALMLNFDTYLSSKQRLPSIRKTYFLTCLSGYLGGLMTTIFVMHVFQAAQPALLYLVPFCIGSVVIQALYRGEFAELLAFENNRHANTTTTTTTDSNTEARTHDSSSSSPASAATTQPVVDGSDKSTKQE